MSSKMASTPDLLALNDLALKSGYNRANDQDVLERLLDPEGVHVSSFTMMHEHAAGVRVEPHIRAAWLVKTNGSLVPQTVWIDVPMPMWDQLEEVPNHVQSDG